MCAHAEGDFDICECVSRCAPKLRGNESKVGIALFVRLSDGEKMITCSIPTFHNILLVK